MSKRYAWSWKNCAAEDEPAAEPEPVAEPVAPAPEPAPPPEPPPPAPEPEPPEPTMVEDVPPPAPKRRGRPPKVRPVEAVAPVLEFPAAPAPEPAPPPAPKRRGRPPKVRPVEAVAPVLEFPAAPAPEPAPPPPVTCEPGPIVGPVPKPAVAIADAEARVMGLLGAVERRIEALLARIGAAEQRMNDWARGFKDSSPAAIEAVLSAEDGKAAGGRCCAWPVSHEDAPKLIFCEAPAEPGRPYCTEHQALAKRRVYERQEAAA